MKLLLMILICSNISDVKCMAFLINIGRVIMKSLAYSSQNSHCLKFVETFKITREVH